ncbi:hypothetical protein QQY66_33400 [Streptomyces sp. DG2A-72]|uniref:hypothetical protein n=1 Tax=Streptomyces sp. DG2A-72 TaxID=3051386 RepID=UPI00265BED84|nr:hypothetical protein [Streptomyces sp. DG2A-72]MDO0936358.1 hypothetical protein [Streptomyces sp. DG2A-72]
MAALVRHRPATYFRQNSKQICGELGIFLEPARSEAMRAKLNRLAERGWLRKLADGKFTTTL